MNPKNTKVVTFDLEHEYKTSRKLINDLIRFSRENKAVFRGVSSVDQLNPVIKRVRSHITNWKKSDLSKFEYDLLNDFKRNASSMLNGFLDTLDIVAYAQHFGLPTRFIDWSRDPFVALYFSISKSKEVNDDYRIYYTHIDQHTLISKSYSGVTHFNLNNGNDFIVDYFDFIRSIESEESNSTLQTAINDREITLEGKVTTTDVYRMNRLVFFDSNASNPRIIAQKGLFSIPTSLKGDEASKEIERNCKYVTLSFSDEERIQTLDFLENMNYSALRLFPDIQNIAASITDKFVFNEVKNRFKD